MFRASGGLLQRRLLPRPAGPGGRIVPCPTGAGTDLGGLVPHPARAGGRLDRVRSAVYRVFETYSKVQRWVRCDDLIIVNLGPAKIFIQFCGAAPGSVSQSNSL